MRKTFTFAMLQALCSSVALAAQEPSREFARQSYDALTSLPTVAAAKWQDLARRRPAAVLGAIAAAERKGWKPTSTTAFFRKTGPKQLRPIAIRQDLYSATSDGEMLVWNWDDGDPSTAEGTVWVHSFVTNNEETFNIQLSGDTYDAMAIPYYEGVDASVTEAWVTGAAAIGPPLLQAPHALAVALRPVQLGDDHGECSAAGEAAGARCLMRAAGDHLREGVRGAAAGQAIGGMIGAFTGGLAGALAGAVGGTLPGFAAGVLTSLIWGTDHACRDEAWDAYYSCLARYECMRQQRASCLYPLVEVAATWAR